MHILVIAEAGVNHNGDIGLARRMIDAAADARADAVKFQSFRAAQLASRQAAKAEYQRITSGSGESQLDMLRRLELSETDHEALIGHSNARGIEFLSTPFDIESLEMLTTRFGLRTVKISSGDITNAPFLLAAARAAKHIVLSTGMSTLAEVENALGVLAFGFTGSAAAIPGQAEFGRSFSSAAGKAALRDRVTLLHCTSEYPAPYAGVNLRAMQAMTEAFRLPVGYSDHTRGSHVALAAVALGAIAIEKHFTLDRALPGPDHQASLEPSELQAMISQIRDLEQALGDGIKRPADSEIGNRSVVRRSLVAARPISKGEPFTDQNLACKRPGTGLTPFEYWSLLGRKATRDYRPDEAIDN
ncbi:MAG: N-acetylneuraminate synthase [Steroidobacteraceae bacterium]